MLQSHELNNLNYLQKFAVIPILFTILCGYYILKLIIPEHRHNYKIKRILGISKSRLFLSSFIDGLLMFIIPFSMAFAIAQVYSVLIFEIPFLLQAPSILFISLIVVVLLSSLQITFSIFRKSLGIHD